MSNSNDDEKITIRMPVQQMMEAAVEFVSLVKRPANSIPLRILKAEDPNETESAMRDFTKMFSGLTRKRDAGESEEVNENRIAGFVVRKAVADRLKVLLEEKGYKTDNVLETDGDIVVFKQEEYSDDTTVPLAVGPDLCVLITDEQKAFSPFLDSQDFMTNVQAGGFMPSMIMASEAMSDTVRSILRNSDDKAEASAAIASAGKAFVGFLDGLAKSLPDDAFKMQIALADINVGDLEDGGKLNPQQAESCPPGMKLVDGECKPDTKADDKSQHPVGGRCPEGMRLVNGRCVPVDKDKKAEADESGTPEDQTMTDEQKAAQAAEAEAAEAAKKAEGELIEEQKVAQAAFDALSEEQKDALLVAAAKKALEAKKAEGEGEDGDTDTTLTDEQKAADVVKVAEAKAADEAAAAEEAKKAEAKKAEDEDAGDTGDGAGNTGDEVVETKGEAGEEWLDGVEGLDDPIELTKGERMQGIEEPRLATDFGEELLTEGDTSEIAKLMDDLEMATSINGVPMEVALKAVLEEEGATLEGDLPVVDGDEERTSEDVTAQATKAKADEDNAEQDPVLKAIADLGKSFGTRLDAVEKENSELRAKLAGVAKSEAVRRQVLKTTVLSGADETAGEQHGEARKGNGKDKDNVWKGSSLSQALSLG